MRHIFENIGDSYNRRHHCMINTQPLTGAVISCGHKHLQHSMRGRMPHSSPLVGELPLGTKGERRGCRSSMLQHRERTGTGRFPQSSSAKVRRPAFSHRLPSVDLESFCSSPPFARPTPRGRIAEHSTCPWSQRMANAKEDVPRVPSYLQTVFNRHFMSTRTLEPPTPASSSTKSSLTPRVDK